MAILSGKKEIKIIDRSIPEILSRNRSIEKSKLLEYCFLLKKIGMDYLEVDDVFCKKMTIFPSNLDLILRIDGLDELEYRSKFSNWVMKADLFFLPEVLRLVKQERAFINLEINYQDISGLQQRLSYINSNVANQVKYIRILDLDYLKILENPQIFVELAQLWPGIRYDLCPDNIKKTATATLVEGIISGVDVVTGAFSGYGKEGNFAALEEVLIATKVIYNDCEVQGDQEILYLLSKLYQRIARNKLPSNKPVLGGEIFNYESGIHADGIEKDPRTYEPFDPSSVGQRRRLCLGKHSGTKAVQTKLKELDISCSPEILEAITMQVKNQSIRTKREVNKGHLRDLYNDVKKEYELAGECIYGG